jgi:hypothetical protein
MTTYPYRYLAEGAIRYMETYIQTNIGSALDNVAQNVGTPKVSLEAPRSYFYYEQPQAYECPAIILVMDDMDFKIEERKSNFLNAQDRINVSVVVEDQDKDTVVVKAWRYQSALHYVLDEATITSSDSAMNLRCVVQRARFSDTYQLEEDRGPGSFRKEVLLECGVTHLEKY